MVTFTDRDDKRGAAIRTAATKTRADRIKDLQQSVGSLDRRVQKALKSGDSKEAKDLRSRQKQFVKDLGDEIAIESGGVMRAAPTGSGDKGRILRTSSGRPVLTSEGFETFQQNMDRGFINPTRDLINRFPKQYGSMYPVANFIQNTAPGLARMAVPGAGILGLDKGPREIPLSGSPLPRDAFPLSLPMDANQGIVDTYGDFLNQQVNSGAGVGAGVDDVTVSDTMNQDVSGESLPVVNVGGIDSFSNLLLPSLSDLGDEGGIFEGFSADIGNKSLDYTTPAPFGLPGDVTISAGPDRSGIMYNLGFGA